MILWRETAVLEGNPEGEDESERRFGLEEVVKRIFNSITTRA